jgi:hypothetical protein
VCKHPDKAGERDELSELNGKLFADLLIVFRCCGSVFNSTPGPIDLWRDRSAGELDKNQVVDVERTENAESSAESSGPSPGVSWSGRCITAAGSSAPWGC